MADPCPDLENAPFELQQGIAAAMAARCVDPAQIVLQRAYLEPVALPAGAVAIELGCSTGYVTCDLIDMCGTTSALGLEPSGVMSDISCVTDKIGATA